MKRSTVLLSVTHARSNRRNKTKRLSVECKTVVSRKTIPRIGGDKLATIKRAETVHRRTFPRDRRESVSSTSTHRRYGTRISRMPRVEFLDDLLVVDDVVEVLTNV